MKKKIHPDYHEIEVVMTDGTTFKTRFGLLSVRQKNAAYQFTSITGTPLFFAWNCSSTFKEVQVNQTNTHQHGNYF